MYIESHPYDIQKYIYDIFSIYICTYHVQGAKRNNNTTLNNRVIQLSANGFIPLQIDSRYDSFAERFGLCCSILLLFFFSFN